MKNRDAVFEALDVIEKNLKREITVEEIATQFNFSFFYFSRLFKGITGYSPKEYMLKRKLSEAARDIVGTRKRIIDIAFVYGFGTPESFTRAFMRPFGTARKAYSRMRRMSRRSRDCGCRGKSGRAALLQGQGPEKPVPCRRFDWMAAWGGGAWYFSILFACNATIGWRMNDETI